MNKRKLRHEDYALQLFNIANKKLVSVRRVQDIDIGTDFRTDMIVEVSDEGTVSYEVDVPVTTLSFSVNLISENPTSSRNPMSWLSALSGFDSENGNLKRVFALGRTLTYHPDGLFATIPVNDFDVGTTRGSSRVDGWVAARNKRRPSQVSRVEALINGQVTSLEFGFDVGSVAIANATIEADGVSRLVQNHRGSTMGCRFATTSDKTTITVDDYDIVLSVWVNWVEVTNWTATNGTTIVFTKEDCGDFHLQTGDVVKYIYLPVEIKVWSDYELLTKSYQRVEIEKSQIEVRLITDTTNDRLVEGLYSIRQYTGGDNVVTYTDDASIAHDPILLKSGHAYIGGELYFSGTIDGSCDLDTTVDTIIDLGLVDGRPDNYWNGVTITIVDGVAAGETLKVKRFINATGSFEMDGSFTVTPVSGDQFRINAVEVENGNASDDRVYFALNAISNEVEIKTFPVASPPTDGVLIASYTTGTDFTSYDDEIRCIEYVALERVQSLTFSIDLSREEVNQLGSDQVVDRSLNKPIIVNTDMTLLDVDEVLMEDLSGASGQISVNTAFRKTLGIQVIIHRNKPISNKPTDESNQRVVFEIIDSTPVSIGQLASVAASGEVGMQLLSDNFRIINIE